MRAWALISAILLAASPAAAQQEESWFDDPARVQAAIAEMRETMLRTGEPVEGWDQGGADPDSEVRRLGAERYYMVSRGPTSGTSVNIITDRPIADFAPAGWRIVDSYGQAGERLEAPQLSFAPYSARYVIATRTNFTPRGGVVCYSALSHALLLEVPGAPATPDDEIIPIMFRLNILALEGTTICVRADGDRENGYTARYFLPDGRPLPALDDPSIRTFIVPAAPVDRLLVPPTAPAGGAGSES